MRGNVVIISVMDKGSVLSKKIQKSLIELDYSCVCAAPKVCAEKYGICAIEENYIQWTGKIFEKYDIILFISAIGIAVRSIAPYVKNKFVDPAVVVIDENGNFVVPILSGHFGGANDFAVLISSIINAKPIITTATDINNKFAVDVFAKKNKLKIIQKEMLKKISAAILSNKKIFVCCDKPLPDKLPNGLIKASRGQLGFSISIFKNSNLYNNVLNLVPQKVHLGIGCRKGVSVDEVEYAVEEFLKTEGIFYEAISRVSTIDIKQYERGIIDYCKKMGWLLVYFTADRLNNAKGDFTASNFVKEVTGTDNVCERAAVLSSNNGQLIIKKRKIGTVTLAAACEEWSVNFG